MMIDYMVGPMREGVSLAPGPTPTYPDDLVPS